MMQSIGFNMPKHVNDSKRAIKHQQHMVISPQFLFYSCWVPSWRQHFSAAHLSYLQPTYLSVQRSNICVQPSVWSVAAYQTQQRFKAAERSATCLHTGERKRSKAEWEYILRCGVPQHLMGDDSCGWKQAEGRKTEVSSPEGRGWCPNTPTGISAAPWWEIPQQLLNACVRAHCLLYSLSSHDNISFSNLVDCWCLNVLNRG